MIQNTALLVMDMQTGTLAMLPDTTALIGNVAKAIAIARANNIPVIYVVVGFRQGTPEINMNNKSFRHSAHGTHRYCYQRGCLIHSN